MESCQLDMSGCSNALVGSGLFLSGHSCCLTLMKSLSERLAILKKLSQVKMTMKMSQKWDEETVMQKVRFSRTQVSSESR